jgi:FkbM family methyltransferase
MEAGMITRPGTDDAATLREVKAYRPLGIRPGDVVLDVGGNIGAFGREAVDAGAEVVALEPHPESGAVYAANVPEATLIRGAAGGEEGMRELWLGPRPTTHSIVPYRGRRPGGLVPVYTLPGLIAVYRPTVLKVDIEGGEYDLDWDLPGIRAVAAELHFFRKAWRAEARRVVRAIEDQGFRPTVPPRDTGKNRRTVGVWHRDAG